MKLGIDLHNIRDGGGINYVTNLVNAFTPLKHGFDAVCLFGAPEVLARFPDAPHIEKHPILMLSRSLPFRLFFLFFRLTRELRKAKCSALYSPGGLYFGPFRPFATISRNMMPFDRSKWSMYPWGGDRLRLYLLRYAHAATFRRADRMIFLTRHALHVVGEAARCGHNDMAIIAHGVNRKRFSRPPERPLVAAISADDDIRLVYPSRLEPYKHQVEVIKAVASLRHDFPRISIALYGPANETYLQDVRSAMAEYDPASEFVEYAGEVPNEELPRIYSTAHLLVFASSCENLPNTVIEALEFGIPVVCSDAEPMPEITAGSSRLFDPRNPLEIAEAIRKSLLNWNDSLDLLAVGHKAAQFYSWDQCADATFRFIRSAIR